MHGCTFEMMCQGQACLSCAPHTSTCFPHTGLAGTRDLLSLWTRLVMGLISMKHNLLFVIFFWLQHLEVESNDFGISSFICNALQTHVLILPGTQLLREIMLCRMPPVITFDIYFYHKSFTMFYKKYYKLNLHHFLYKMNIVRVKSMS